MAFDISTARPNTELVKRKSGFDISTAKPEEAITPEIVPAKRKMFGNASIPERLKVASQYGIVPAITGDTNREINKGLNEATPDVYQVAGNVIGGVAGGPGGSAYGGSIGRGVGRVMQDVGAGRKPTVESFRKGATAGAGGELFGIGTSKALESSIPFAKNAAKSLVLSYLKPKGELLEKGGQIADTILKEDLARGSMGKMLGKASTKAQQLTSEVDAMISKYGSRKGTAKAALGELDNLANTYIKEGDPSSGEAVLKLKENLIKGRNLTEPVIQEESRKFVIPKGSESKSVTPKMGFSKKTESVNRGLRQSVAEETGEELTNKGFFQRKPNSVSAIGKRTITPKSYIEDPTDFVALNRPGKQVAYIAPESTVNQTAEEIAGGYVPSIKKQVGEAYREVPVGEIQDMKRAQYRALSRKRSGGGYGSELKSAEIEGRQGYASGLKREVENSIPEENIAGKNERIANLIDSVKALQEREPVAGKRNFADLGDLILGGASFKNPATLSALAAKRILGSDTGKNFMARKLYNYSEGLGPTAKRMINNRFGRSLFGARMSNVFDE